MKICAFLALALGIALSSYAHAETVLVKVEGMVCSSCAKKIEKDLSALPSVQSAKVEFKKHLVRIDTQKGIQLEDALIEKTLTDAGFHLKSIKRVN